MKGSLGVAALAVGAVGSNAWNTNEYPEKQVFYYSQWAVYGERPPPGNPGSTSGGSYMGRFFYLDDFHAKANMFYAPVTEKIINFSFAGIDMESCKVQTVDFWADLLIGAGKALGPECGDKAATYVPAAGWENGVQVGGSELNATGLACSLRALKKKDPSFQIALSIGGWTMSSEFGRCARDSTKRKALVDSLEFFIDRYALDIVDLDWEYPSKAGCGGGTEDFCKMVISRGKRYSPNNKSDSSQCDPGAIYRLYDHLNVPGLEETIREINTYDSIGQAVSTAEECSAFHHPHWPNVPSGEKGMAAYWAKAISNTDWVNYIQLLTDFSNKQYSKSRKLKVTSAVGMDTCMSTGYLNGKKCEAKEGIRSYPADPKGQNKSLKQFCDVQSNSGGHVNLMTYDFNGNWGAPYHNAPLYDNPALRAYEDYLWEYNVDLSSRNWLVESAGGRQPEADGCTPKQLNVGLALYGRTFKNAGAFAKFEGKRSTQKQGVGTYQSGVISLWDVRHRFLNAAQGGKCEGSSWGTEHCGKWELKRDVLAGCVPWLEKKNSDGSFDHISFDDDYSLGLKAKWARCMGFKGLIYWDAADDQDGLGSQASWKAWQSVKKSDCNAIFLPPTDCPGAKGKNVCFGNVADDCNNPGTGGGTGGENGGSGGNGGETGGETGGGGNGGESGGGGGGENDCPNYQNCIEGCLVKLT